MTTAPVKPLEVTIYPPQNLPEPQAAGDGSGLSVTFEDILDTLNPLHHIPILSSIYESISGDDKSDGAGIAGGALFGGPLGFLSNLLDSILKSETGETITGHVLNLFAQEEGAKQAENQDPEEYISASRYNSQNAYVSVQNWLA